MSAQNIPAAPATVNPAKWTHGIAAPGHRYLIDVIKPETGLTLIEGETLEQVRLRHPNAVLVNLAEWRAARGAEQDTPVEWIPTTEEKYWDALGALPPAAQAGAAFLLGEPQDTHIRTGAERFDAYYSRGNTYLVSSRPITRTEFRLCIWSMLAA
jgi:hypothetical protein